MLVSTGAWAGGEETREALRALPWVEEAHVVAGSASLLLKVRARSNRELQGVLRRLYDVGAVTGTETVVVLETFFERPVDPHADPDRTAAGG